MRNFLLALTVGVFGQTGLAGEAVALPDTVTLFGFSSDRGDQEAFKKPVITKRLWIHQKGQWVHPMSMLDEAGTRWNLLRHVSYAAAYKQKIAFMGVVTQGSDRLLGLFLYEPGQKIRALAIYRETGVNYSPLTGKPKPLPQAIETAFENEYLAEFVKLENAQSTHAKFLKKILPIDFNGKNPQYPPLGWLADGKTILVWDKKRVLFAPVDGTPIRTLTLKALHQKLGSRDGGRIRIAFPQQEGAAPVLTDGQTVYTVTNDGQFKPWPKHGDSRNHEPSTGEGSGEIGGDVLGFGPPEIMEVLHKGGYLRLAQKIYDRQGDLVWKLGRKAGFIRQAKDTPIVAVNYKNRQIRIKDLASDDAEKVLKFKVDLVDFAISFDGQSLAVALFGKKKRQFINDIELIDIKSGERRRLGINFLPFLQFVGRPGNEFPHPLSRVSSVLFRTFDQFGAFPKLFAYGDRFYFRATTGELNAVDPSGTVHETTMAINPYMIWHAFEGSFDLFNDYAIFIREPEKPGLFPDPLRPPTPPIKYD